MNHVLIVDDDPDSAASMLELVGEDRFKVTVAHNLRDARTLIAKQPPQLMLLDLQLPDGNGMELLKESSPESKVVLVTGHASLDSSIAALRHGALDYLVKPVSMNRLEDLLARFSPHTPASNQAKLTDPPSHGLQSKRDAKPGLKRESSRFGGLRGRSEVMQRVYEQIERVAATSVTVLITGESGSGKEVVAQTVHDYSTRHTRPFLALNCGAISPHLIESEIFGHEKGSFTGAERLHQGFFERAAGGTLFLDEITEMPLELQVKLLRVLETGRFMRVGSTQSLSTNVRIIAATNRSPLAAIASGKLREDLFYRLNVFPMELPPLRARLEDIPLLAEHFLQAIGEREGTPKRLTPQALQRLSEYTWPGNVRELRNAVQRAYVMAKGALIDEEWLPRQPPDALTVGVSANVDNASVRATTRGENTITVPVGSSMAEAERQLIQATLKHCRYQKEKTAALLGISLKTLYNRLRDYANVKEQRKDGSEDR